MRENEKETSMEDLVRNIGEIAKTGQKLARRAEQQYALEVETILQTQNREHQHIERLLDLMLDFCFDSKVLDLYKKLCRYYFEIDPRATASYVNAYREMWDEGEKSL